MTSEQNEQYFEKAPRSASDPGLFWYSFRSQRFCFWTDAGVFSRHRIDRGTEVLLESLPLPLSGWGVDLGCGYGPLGIIAAACSPQARMELIDVNQRAVALARRNVEANGLPLQRVRVWQGDGLAALPDPIAGQLDFVLTNPPIRAGKELLHRWVDEVWHALRPGGRLYLVIRTQQGAESLRRYLESVFGSDHCRLRERASGYRVFEATRGDLETAP